MNDAARALALWEIGQLPIRYALAIDSRDVEMIAHTFSESTDAGKWGQGRDGMRAFFRSRWRLFRRSVHTISNHSIDLTSETTAKGTVYCQAQQENAETGQWSRLQFAYQDQYVREACGWLFLKRTIRFWYKEFDGVKEFGEGKNDALPQAWPTWTQYWASISDTDE